MVRPEPRKSESTVRPVGPIGRLLTLLHKDNGRVLRIYAKIPKKIKKEISFKHESEGLLA